MAEQTWRKSSYSNETGGNCVEVGWRKSSHSNASEGNCVEVNLTPARVGVRDSKNTAGPALAFPESSWRAFVGR